MLAESYAQENTFTVQSVLSYARNTNFNGRLMHPSCVKPGQCNLFNGQVMDPPKNKTKQNKNKNKKQQEVCHLFISCSSEVVFDLFCFVLYVCLFLISGLFGEINR